MADAVCERIMAVLDARLETVDGVQSYEAEPTGDPDGFPALALYQGDLTLIESETGSSRYRMTVSVMGFVEGGSGARARAERSNLYAATVKVLMADPTLDGLAETIEESGDLALDGAELASDRRLGFAQDFEITFATVRGDPTQLA
jgi:hypothetical protein